MNMMEEGTDFGPVGSGGNSEIPVSFGAQTENQSVVKPTGQILDNGPSGGHDEIRSELFHNSGVILNGLNIPTSGSGSAVPNFIPDDFPGRPYASMRDAIRANDIEAIAPFLQADNFNPDERGDNNKT